MLDWEKLKSIQFDYNILEKDIEPIKRINRELYEESYKMFSSSQMNFVKGTREQLLNEELKRAENWCNYISRSIQRLATSTGGELFEFEHRLKSRSSLDEKYQNAKLTDDEEDGRNGLNNILALEKALNKIHDNVRYTIQYRFDEYVEKYFEAQRLLKSNGFKTIKVKNTWLRKDSYKGINTIVESFNQEKERRYLFELQFHNEVSVEAKNRTHSLYEIVRNENKYTEEERIKANDKRNNIFNSLSIPSNIDQIKEFDFLG